MKIYTKTGDSGTTSLIGGRRVAKCDKRIEAYGALDELNAHLGMLVSLTADEDVRVFVEQIQCDLFDIGSYLAADPPGNLCRGVSVIDDGAVRRLEEQIDAMVFSIPEQTCFIIPGGCREATWAHVCRTVCRRAERRMVDCGKDVCLSPQILHYMNRLSDYLFVLARKLNFVAHTAEKKWQSTCK